MPLLKQKRKLKKKTTFLSFPKSQYLPSLLGHLGTLPVQWIKNWFYLSSSIPATGQGSCSCLPLLCSCTCHLFKSNQAGKGEICKAEQDLPTSPTLLLIGLLIACPSNYNMIINPQSLTPLNNPSVPFSGFSHTWIHLITNLDPSHLHTPRSSLTNGDKVQNHHLNALE